MKSFLREIESKFVELEEATPEEVENQEKLNLQLAKTAELTKQITGEAFQDDANQDGISDTQGMPVESHCGSHNEEEIEEMSNTAGVAAYQTPRAFAPSKRKMKNRKDKTYDVVQEAMDRKYEHLIESYRQFSRGDKKITPENKVKKTIQEVSKKLREIETLIKHTSQLKMESGISRENYGPRTEKALNKISEKLIKIAERVRALGE
tara:strand:+ start:3593 stop:4213 length:621 start_codon:yes stop_codon:yes gene_type:complete